jgi:hypothetical protein
MRAGVEHVAEPGTVAERPRGAELASRGDPRRPAEIEDVPALAMVDRDVAAGQRLDLVLVVVLRLGRRVPGGAAVGEELVPAAVRA